MIGRICSIEDCGRKHEAKGFCKAHYERLRRHGDPLGGRTPDGEPMEFYQSVVRTHEGDDCLLWPYTRCTNGYGQMIKNGRLGIVSRILCEDIHGPPPTSEHEAAHSCGKGREGCVTKRHLSWKTPKENQTDRILHDTHSRGERNATAKLTEAQVREIIALKGHLSQRKIAEKFGVSPANVGRIHAGTSWGWLKDNCAPLAQIVRGLDGVTPGPWVVKETTVNGIGYGGHWLEVADENQDICISGSGGAKSYTQRVVDAQVHDDNEANLRHFSRCSPDAIREIAAYVRDLEERLAKAAEALEPFQSYAENEWTDHHGDETPILDEEGEFIAKLGDFRRARTALTTIRRTA